MLRFALVELKLPAVVRNERIQPLLHLREWASLRNPGEVPGRIGERGAE